MDPTTINTAVTAIAIIIGIAGLYIADYSRIYLFGDKYKGIYGKYKLFNYSRERSQILHAWDVEIKKWWFSAPRVVAVYKEIPSEGHRYKGHLNIVGDGMLIWLSERRVGLVDAATLAFKAPAQNRIEILPGFLCGFRKPIVPYCGVHVLCAERWGKDDIAKIFSGPADKDQVNPEKEMNDIWYEAFADRALALVRAQMTSRTTSGSTTAA